MFNLCSVRRLSYLNAKSAISAKTLLSFVADFSVNLEGEGAEKEIQFVVVSNSFCTSHCYLDL